MRVTIQRSLRDEDAAILLQLHRETFAPLERVAAARQALPDDLFDELVHDPRTLKFIGWDRAGHPAGLALVTTDLDLVPWISPTFYEERYPEQFGRGAIYYFLSLFIGLRHQRGPLFDAMVEAISLTVAADHGVVAFDTSRFDIETLDLPALIAEAGRRYVEGETLELDSQHYYGYAFTAVKPDRAQRRRRIEIDLTIPPPVIDLRDERVEEQAAADTTDQAREQRR